MAIHCEARVIRPSQPRTDRHYFSGLAIVRGLPAAFRRVAVLDRGSLELLAITRTAADGSYRFYGLPEYGPESLLALCLDDEAVCDAVARDRVTQCVEP